MSLRQDIIHKYVNLSEVHDQCRLDLDKTYDKNKPTILIVDDFEAILKLFKRLVKRMDLVRNFNIVYSSNSNAGLKVLNELQNNDDFNVTAVITDITFGGSIDVGTTSNFNLDGIKLVGILKDIFPDILYHFITGHIISRKATPIFYKEFEAYSGPDADLHKYVSYKDVPVSTNKDLFLSLFKGTDYEELI